MKKHFLSFLFLSVASASSHGQITLTGASNNPVVGNSFITINCDTTGFNPIMMGLDRGANKTWNYSTLTSISTDTAVAVTCASTPYCSLMAVTPTLAQKTLSASAYSYTINNNDSVALVGYYQSAGQKTILTNPMKTLKYPFAYTDSFVDTYAGTIVFTPPGMSSPITAHPVGSITVVADGYGTLMLPGSSVADTVLRVRGQQSYTDSVMILSTTVPITVLVTTFEWFKKNTHAPIMSVTYINQIAGPGSLNTKTVSYIKRNTVDVANVTLIDNSLTLYPNPATDELNIKFDAATTTENVRVSLVDLAGREVTVLADATTTGVQEIKYNTSSLPKGMYIVRVQSGSETVTRKVSIQ